MAKNSSNKKNTTGLALACWILGFIVLVIVFLVKQDEIYTNLKTTRFFERLFGKTPTFIENHEIKDQPTIQQNNNIITFKSEEPSKTIEEVQIEVPKTQDLPVEKTETVKPQPATVKEEPKKVEKTEKNEATPVVETKKQENPVKPVVPKTKVKLYFVTIGEDGYVNTKDLVREVEKNDSPLSTNIKLLLNGPVNSEKSKGYKSLIPGETRLLGASVRDGIAYLNFSEEFEFNSVGVEGYIAQLKQIVFTATEFSTVKSVQILVDGQKKEYLGSEGVWIGSPLSRSSF